MWEKLSINWDEIELFKSTRLRHFLAAPFIMAMIMPLVIFDFFLEMYHRICFPLYRIPIIRRENYIKYGRQKLPYLSPLEKIFCAYCSYANGLIHYAQKIAADTETYWCAIKYKKQASFIEPAHHKDFAEYGDEQEYRKLKKQIRGQ